MARENSDTRFRELFEGSPDAIFVENADGFVLDVNQAACRLHEMDRDELVGMQVFDLVPPKERQTVQRKFAQLVAGDLELVEGWSLSKSGRSIPVELRVSHIDYEDQLALLLHVREVTERKNAVDELERTEKRLKLTLDATKTNCWDVTLDRDEVISTEMWLKRFEYDESEWKSSRTWCDGLVHPDDVGNIRQTLQDHLEGRAPIYECEYRVRAKSGEWHWILDRGVVVERDANGNPYRMVGTDTDITDRKRAEIKLLESETRFRSLVDNSYDVITMFDATGKPKYISPSIKRVLGYDPSELIGRPGIEIIHPDDLQEAGQSFARGLEQPRQAMQMTHRLRHKDGSYRTVEVTGINLLDVPGVEAMVSNFRDITERKRTDNAIRGLYEIATDSTASHDDKVQRVLQLGRERFGLELAILGIVDGQRYRVTHVAAPGDFEVVPGAEFALKDTYCQLAIEAGAPLAFHNAGKSEHAKHPFFKAFALESYLGAPIHVNGKTIGALCFTSRSSRSIPFSESDKDFAQLMARWIGSEMERIAVEEELKQSEERYRLFVEHSKDGVVLYEFDEPVPVDLPAEEQVLRIHRGHHFATCNDAFAKMYGFSCAWDLIGKRAQDVDGLEDNLTELNRTTLLRFIRNGYHVSDALTEEFDKDGNPIFISSSEVGLIDDGHLTHVWTSQRDVSARVMAEHALRIRDRALASASNGVVITDPNQPDNPIIFCNAAFRRMTGYMEQEVLGRNCRFLQKDDQGQAALEEVRTAIREHRGCRVTLRNYRKDGEMFWNELTLSPVFDDQQRLTHFVGIQNEITERVQAQDAMALRERQQAVVAELGKLAISGGSLNSLMDEVVRSVSKALDVKYCKILKLLPGQDALTLLAGVGWNNGLVGTATVGTDIDSQAGYTLHSDSPVIVEDLASETRFSGPKLLHDHKVVSGLSVIIHGPETPFGVLGAHSTEPRLFTKDDVNFLQAVANLLGDAIQRKRDEQALRASEEKFRSIVETTADWIWEMDLNGRHTYSNRRLQTILGYTHAEFFGLNVFEIIHPDDCQQVEEKLSKIIELKLGWANWIIRMRHKDGTYRYLESNATPVVDDSGELIGFRGSDRDITYRKEYEEELVRQKAEIEHVSRLSTMGELTSGMAHELAQPLTAIANYAEALLNLAQNDSLDCQAIEDVAGPLRKTTFRTNEIMQRLRSLVKKGTPHRSPVDANDIIREVVDFLTPQLQRSKIRVRMDLDKSPSIVLADSIQIQQVLVNLIKNAQEAMSDTAEVQRVLTVRSRQADDTVTITVIDAGHGFSIEDAEQLFEHFYTTTEGGLGVGLRICRSIVESHQGKVWAESNRDRGATFHFTLPIASLEPADAR